MSDFYGSIVNNLKQEVEMLNTRLEKFRVVDNMNMYIATLKSLRETLDLIKKYDWRLMYSEYGVNKYDKNEIEKELTEINDALDLMCLDPNCNEEKFRELVQQKLNIEKQITNDTMVTEVAVWEQNHEGQIRNHKKWRIDVPYKNVGGTRIDDRFHVDSDGVYINGVIKTS